MWALSVGVGCLLGAFLFFFQVSDFWELNYFWGEAEGGGGRLWLISAHEKQEFHYFLGIIETRSFMFFSSSLLNFGDTGSSTAMHDRLIRFAHLAYGCNPAHVSVSREKKRHDGNPCDITRKHEKASIYLQHSPKNEL